MFGNIKEHQFNIWIEEPKKFVISVPEGDAYLVSEQLWRTLEWLYMEFLEDCEDTELEHGNLIPRDFSDRNISRMISYVIHASLLEGVLKRMYTKMIEYIQKYVDSNVEADETALEKRREEMEDAREFRNAIAAHTAYADPHAQKDDALSEANSLHAFLSVGYDDHDLSNFQMHASTVVSNAGTSKRTIPKLRLKDLHDELSTHFEAWEGMFVDKLTEASQHLPIDKRGEYKVTP